MKKCLVVVFLTLILLTACSGKVSKEDYDKATEQINQLKEELSSSEKELEDLQKTDDELQTAYDKLQEEREEEKKELEAMESLQRENEQLKEENTTLKEENSNLKDENAQLAEQNDPQEAINDNDPLESLKGMTFKSENTSQKYNPVLGNYDVYSYIVFTDSPQYPVLIETKLAEKSYNDVKNSLSAEGIQGTRRPYNSTITAQGNDMYTVEIRFTDLFDQKEYTYSFDFYINAKGAESGISISNVKTDEDQPCIWDDHYLVAE